MTSVTGTPARGRAGETAHARPVTEMRSGHGCRVPASANSRHGRLACGTRRSPARTRRDGADGEPGARVRTSPSAPGSPRRRSPRRPARHLSRPGPSGVLCPPTQRGTCSGRRRRAVATRPGPGRSCSGGNARSPATSDVCAPWSLAYASRRSGVQADALLSHASVRGTMWSMSSPDADVTTAA